MIMYTLASKDTVRVERDRFGLLIYTSSSLAEVAIEVIKILQFASNSFSFFES